MVQGFDPGHTPIYFGNIGRQVGKAGVSAFQNNFTVELWALGHFFAELVRCFAKVLLRYFVGTFVTWQ